VIDATNMRFIYLKVQTRFQPPGDDEKTHNVLTYSDGSKDNFKKLGDVLKLFESLDDVDKLFKFLLTADFEKYETPPPPLTVRIVRGKNLDKKMLSRVAGKVNKMLRINVKGDNQISFCYDKKGYMKFRQKIMAKRTRKRGIAVPFLSFCVRKENVQHHNMRRIVAKCFSVDEDRVGFAGMKDTCAVTTQFGSVRFMGTYGASGTPSVEDIASFLSLKSTKNSFAQIKAQGVTLGNFKVSLKSQTLQKGDLMGNQFKLVLKSLRHVESGSSSNFVEKVEISTLEAAVDHIKRHGFLNFFGEQRIGDAGEYDEVGAKSSDIGLALLRSDDEQTIEHIMVGRYLIRGKRTDVEDNWHKARKAYLSEHDPVQSFDILRRGRIPSSKIEYIMMECLAKGGSAEQAVRKIPFDAKEIHINAYQALMFNHFVSIRNEIYGKKVVVGDLYIITGDFKTRMEAKNNSVMLRDNIAVVKSEAEITEKGIDIGDIVLPLFGLDSMFPNNAAGIFMKKKLEEDGFRIYGSDGGGGGTEDGEEGGKGKGVRDGEGEKEGREGGISIKRKGTYRKVIVVPTNVDFRDEFHEKTVNDSSESNGNSNEDGDGDRTSCDDIVKQYIDEATISFQLPSGSFATMMMRELLRRETGGWEF